MRREARRRSGNSHQLLVTVDDGTNFPTTARLASYAGLAPKYSKAGRFPRLPSDGGMFDTTAKWGPMPNDQSCALSSAMASTTAAPSAVRRMGWSR